MNEPKNPYPEYLSDEVPKGGVADKAHSIWQECDTAWREYLRSLVGEKGREEIAKALYYNYIGKDFEKPVPEWGKGWKSVEMICLTLADSLVPIIGAIADKLAEEQIQERGLVKLEKSQKVPMYSEKYRLTSAGNVRKNFDYSDYSMRYRFEKQVREYLRKNGFRRVRVKSSGQG